MNPLIAGQQIDIFRPPQARDQFILLPHRGSPVVNPRRSGDARKAPRSLCVMNGLRGADQRLRRHATDIDASAADRAVPDKRNARTLLIGSDRGSKPGRTGPDNDEIVSSAIAWRRTAIVHVKSLVACERR